MSQHDFVIDDASGAVVRADLNAALQALASNNAGATAPTTTYAGMWWIDTTTSTLKRRNAGNTAWIIRDRTDAAGMVDKAAGFTVGLADFGKVFRCTAALTIAVTAAATLTDGFWFGIVNSHASGVVTIDPDSAETIDGAATKSVPAGFSCFVFCNAALFRTIGMPPDVVGDAGAGGTRGLAPAPAAGDAAAGKFLKASGAWAAPSGGWTLGTAQQPAAVAAVDFTGIPAGVNAIEIMVSELQQSGADDILVQIGDAGGIETSGYVGTGRLMTSVAEYTTGFKILNQSSSHRVQGFISLRRLTGNLWTCSYTLGNRGTVSWFVNDGGGTKTLSAVLDRVRIASSSGAAVLSADNINIMYQ